MHTLDLRFFGFVVELLSIMLFFVVIFYIGKIKLLTRGLQKYWNSIAIASFLIIIRRLFTFFVNYINNYEVVIVLQYVIIPLILLSITLLCIYGFYGLSKSFHAAIKTKKNKRKE